MRDESECRYDPVALLVSWLRMLAEKEAHVGPTGLLTGKPSQSSALHGPATHALYPDPDAERDDA